MDKQSLARSFLKVALLGLLIVSGYKFAELITYPHNEAPKVKKPTWAEAHGMPPGIVDNE